MNEPQTPLERPTARRAATRRAVPLDSRRMVEFSAWDPARSLPLLAQPIVDELSLPDWLAQNRDDCAARLRVHGALLFRGFRPPTVADFERLLRDFSGELLHYTYGSTPRQLVSGRVYTSTEYPAALAIPLHNEMSYTRQWPLKLGLLCVTAPTCGGETPIADSRRILARIPVALRTEFARRGVMYVRNYGPGLDVSWQATFQTSDRHAVEAYCRSAGIECEWTADDGLRTRQVCQGLAVHPETHEEVWFNQAHLFHVSNLDQETRALLTENIGDEHLPRNACFGDGGAIGDAALATIRQALQAETVLFPWQTGDVLLLDNMLAAHGRQPFTGPRKIVVGMNQPYQQATG